MIFNKVTLYKNLPFLKFDITFIVLLLIVFVQNFFAGTVQLDQSFNGVGYRTQSISFDGSYAESVAIQNDGKIVVGGSTWSASGPTDYATLRLNTNGTLDTQFDLDGMVVTSLGPFDRGNKTLIQTDGKILLTGERYAGASNYDFAIVRYNTNGSLDNSFDGNGVAAPVISGFSEERCYDAVLQSDGKIVLVGTTSPTIEPTPNPPTDIAIMRLNTDGSLDTGFNGSGILVIRFQGVNESANAVVIQQDGKIVIGGFLFNGLKNDFLLMRFQANGFLDTGFGQNGLVITSVNSSNNSISTLALQNDGKILAGGSNAIVRYNSNGTVDNTFGNNGFAISTQSVNEIFLTANENILIAGSLNNNIAVSKYKINGTRDNNFNNTGIFTTTVPNNQCAGTSLSVQSDNKIVVAGVCSNFLTAFAVFRLQELSNKVPFDYDGDGKTDLSIFRSTNGQWWLNQSSTGNTKVYQFGQSTDKIVPSDYTGDGKTDVAFFREGQWFILRSENDTFYAAPFGATGDVPAPGDFDADGRADLAVFRPTAATWFILQSTAGTRIVQFGATGDIPVVGDYDGDAKADLAIFRPANGQWWLNWSSNNSTKVYQFGQSTDKVVPADYTGDGKTDVAFFRNGQWFILRSENETFYGAPFGTTGDIPAVGDYDGDGRADLAVFRPTAATWFILRTTQGALIQQFGANGDIPTPSAFIP